MSTTGLTRHSDWTVIVTLNAEWVLDGFVQHSSDCCNKTAICECSSMDG